ncbi:hypothetical protein V6N11_009848, partial [Hibiscus sabdariffa]
MHGKWQWHDSLTLNNNSEEAILICKYSVKLVGKQIDRRALSQLEYSHNAPHTYQSNYTSSVQQLQLDARITSSSVLSAASRAVSDSGLV